MPLATLNRRTKVTDMDMTADTIEDALRQLPELPTPVTSWHVETGSDSTDDPAGNCSPDLGSRMTNS